MPLFGNRVKELRENLGYTQEELADLIGTNQREVSQYENGRQPRAPRLARLAEVLETTTDYLLGLSEEPLRALGGVSDLNSDERELVMLYREKSPAQRKRIMDVVRVL